jgi:hypothetical protein
MRIDLTGSQVLRMHEAAGSTVTVHAGAVWITEQNDPRDVVLQPGQRFTFGRAGLALVEAFGNASISVES